MNCPACARTLREIRYEGVAIRTCDGCGGEFIGAEQMRHIVIVREERFGPGLVAAMAGRRPAFGRAAPDSPARRNCPSCASPMSVVNYATDTGIHVDRCTSCGGIWLDNTELEKVQILLERWQDEAPAQIRALADELDDAARQVERQLSAPFRGSRFAFVNAVINRLLDAA